MTSSLTTAVNWLMEYAILNDFRSLQSTLTSLFPDIIPHKLILPNRQWLLLLATMDKLALKNSANNEGCDIEIQANGDSSNNRQVLDHWKRILELMEGFSREDHLQDDNAEQRPVRAPNVGAFVEFVYKVRGVIVLLEFRYVNKVKLIRDCCKGIRILCRQQMINANATMTEQVWPGFDKPVGGRPDANREDVARRVHGKIKKELKESLASYRRNDLEQAKEIREKTKDIRRLQIVQDLVKYLRSSLAAAGPTLLYDFAQASDHENDRVFKRVHEARVNVRIKPF